MTTGAESLLTMPEKLAALILLLAVSGVAVRTLMRRVAVVLDGRGAAVQEGGLDFGRFLLYVPGQWTNIRNISFNDLAGVQHLMLFWGAICFACYYGIFFFLGEGFGLSELLRANPLAQFFLPVTEIFGVLLVVALVWGLLRRAALKPARLGPHFEVGMFLAIAAAGSVLLASFYGLEAVRFDLGISTYTGPLSGLAAPWLSALSGGSAGLSSMYHLFWWTQVAIIACFIFYVPYSDHQHAVFAPFNILNTRESAKGKFSATELSELYQGVKEPKDLSRKQLLEVYGCTQCGRCQEVCPAACAGKALSPKKMIQHVRGAIDQVAGIRPFWKGEEISRALAERVADEELWSCTTCMACVEVCPACVSAVDKVVEIRRDRIMAGSSFYPEVATLFRELETYGDVFGKGRARREDWAVGSQVKVLSQRGEQADTLFWVGCQASFHDRSKRSAVSLVEVLKKAGVDLAILGKGELCCGDPMRRLGNEFQYQNFVQKNIETLKNYGFKRIVTYCPHCYNTLKNEYPQFGGGFEVVHYTELLQDLISTGKLQLTKELPAKVVYHDPCYLARGNDLAVGHDIVAQLPAARPVELERCGSSTFCCGGGGGAMWMRETGGEKINELRVKELAKDEPDVIATSCPYCVMMLESGVNALGLEKVKCLDLIEMVRETI